MDNDAIQATADGWTVSCADPQVSQLRFDHRFVLLVGSGTSITIEEAFELTTASASTTLQDSEDPLAMAPALVLLHRSVASIEVRSSGSLRLSFDDGSTISVGVNEHFENWQIDLASGQSLVGLPGGGVASWSEPNSEHSTALEPDVPLA